MGADWTLDDVGDLTGTVAVVTGANSGLGFETTKALRAKGALVIMACRNQAKADAARTALLADGPGPEPEIELMDLEDLASVRAAATAITDRHPALTLLINNAGVMGLRGPDGSQRQMNANHLGHVALTAALLPALEAGGGRIVMVSSNLHRQGTLSVDAPIDVRSQSPSKAYGSTKLANLVFCFEADRRLRGTGSSVSIRAAHPGWARSGLSSGATQGRGALSQRLGTFAGAHLGQKTARGALPTLRAALDPSIPPGGYVGPDGFMEMWGDPVPVGYSTAASDPALAAAVFDASLEATSSPWPT
jgi:protochlorophyllide reductase